MVPQGVEESNAQRYPLPIRHRLMNIRSLPLLVMALLAPLPTSRSEYQSAEICKRRKLEANRVPEEAILCGSLSTLEANVVKPPSQTDYMAQVRAFLAWAASRRLDWQCQFSCDMVLVLFLDEMFFKGHPSSLGSRTLAALIHFAAGVPHLYGASFARSRRALKAWSKLAPSRMRMPFPWLALVAVLGLLVWDRDIEVAIILLLQFETYLRPGAMDALLVRQMRCPIPQAGRGFQLWTVLANPYEDNVPGKTGIYDMSVVLDRHQWLHPFLMVLTCHRDPNAPLWNTNGGVVSEKLQRACRLLGLENLKATRYSLRHGGASHDLVTRFRDAASVKQRGGWRCDESLKRYGKEGRALTELSKLPKPVLAFAKEAEGRLEDLFHFRARMAPPLVGRA